MTTKANVMVSPGGPEGVRGYRGWMMITKVNVMVILGGNRRV